MTKQFMWVFSKKPEKWWQKTFMSFTHVETVAVVQDVGVHFEALWTGPSITIFDLYTAKPPEFSVFFEVQQPKPRRNSLSRPILMQSCVTLAQYIAGVWLGAYTPDKLYKIITTWPAERLAQHGIRRTYGY